MEDADFCSVSFNGPADFSRSTFLEKINLQDTEFKKNVHFESCRINTLNLTRSRYEWLFLHWDSVNHLEKDEQAHQKLIDNYERLQWETDSSECRLACSNETAAEDAKDYSWIMGLLDIDRLAKGFALLPDRGENIDDGNARILI